MLYFSLLHLYGINDDWGKALLTMGSGKHHNDTNSKASS